MANSWLSKIGHTTHSHFADLSFIFISRIYHLSRQIKMCQHFRSLLQPGATLQIELLQHYKDSDVEGFTRRQLYCGPTEKITFGQKGTFDFFLVVYANLIVTSCYQTMIVGNVKIKNSLFPFYAGIRKIRG